MPELQVLNVKVINKLYSGIYEGGQTADVVRAINTTFKTKLPLNDETVSKYIAPLNHDDITPKATLGDLLIELRYNKKIDFICEDSLIQLKDYDALTYDRINDYYNLAIESDNMQDTFMSLVFTNEKNNTQKISKDLQEKAGVAFDYMYSFYRGERTDSNSNKNRDITSDVTKWDKVKAFLLALITAGISMKYNWSTKAKKEKYADFKTSIAR